MINRPDPIVEKRVAVLCDIHGNVPALEAVLREVRREGVGAVVVGGDLLPGPMPGEALEMLLGLDASVRFLHGNGDREALSLLRGEPSSVPEAFREGVRWSAEQLTAAQQAIVAAWPPTIRLQVEGIGDVLFCHATPRNDTEVFTRLTPDDRLIPIFDRLDVALVVCGHTHMAFDRTVGRVRVVNAGSIGMPFGAPGAHWLMLGPGVELRHTPYDLEAAADRIRQTQYPMAGDFAAQYVLQPPTEAKMLELFAAAELK